METGANANLAQEDARSLSSGQSWISALRLGIAGLARLTFGGRPLYALILLASIAFVTAYQILEPSVLNVGRPGDASFTQFVNQESTDKKGNSFRRTSPDSYFFFPGLGGGYPYQVEIHLKQALPNPEPIAVFINGQQAGTIKPTPEWQAYTFKFTRPEDIASRNVNVEMKEDGTLARGERYLGSALVDRVSVIPLVASWSQFVNFSPFVVAFLLLVLALCYLMAIIVLVGLRSGERAATRSWPAAMTDQHIRLMAAGLAVPALALLALGLAQARTIAATVSYPAAILLAAAIAMFLLMRVALPRVFSWAGLNTGGLETAALAGLMSAIFLVKIAVILYPTLSVVDLPFHLRFVRAILNGHFLDVYLPHTAASGTDKMFALNQLSSPPKEWNMDILIPKSPLFYVLVTPLGWLPFDLGASLRVFVVLLDLSYVPMVYYFARRAIGLDRSGGLIAAAVYALTPLTFRLLILGTYPTVFAQWITLVSFTYIAVRFDSLRRWTTWLTLTGLLTVVMLSFPTMVVFGSLVIGLVGIGVWIWGERERKGNVVRLYGALAASLVLAFLLYYVQYVGPIIQATLPVYAKQLSGSSQGTGGFSGLDFAVTWAFGFLGSPAPFALGVVGLFVYWIRRDKRLSVAWMLMLSWLLVGAIFVPVTLFTDMIGKHVIFVIVPAAVAAGAGGQWLWRHRVSAGRAVVGIALAQMGWASIAFTVARLAK
ncbi:MAG: hypothetical protein M1358_05010 [Chloroflexi bacterium]|nr:hypothetical protein [Chloroflexota bacterium]